MIGLNLSYKIYSGIDVVPEDIGRVLSVSRNSILLETASGELTISNSKKMINGMLPVIGDWCVINSDRTTVSKILCRKNVVSRKVSGTQLYLFHVLNSLEVKKYFRSVAKTTTNISNITFEDLGNLVLPLPGLDEQLKIIDELNRYQEIIVGAKKIVNNYLPKLPSYEIVVSTSLNDSELFDIQSGGTPSTKNLDYWDGDISWITLADLPQEEYVTTIDTSVRTITKKGLDNSSAKMLPVGAIVVSTRATIGRVGIVKHPLATNQGFKNVVIKKPDVVIPEFLALLLREKTEEMELLASGATFKEISKFNFGKIEVALPSLDEQKRILLKIHEEESFVEPAKKVIEVFESKIETVINKVWGE